MSNFWTKLKKPFTILAPMDDVTDDVFRQVILFAGRPDVFFTEFTNADGLLHGANGIPRRKLNYTDSQHPIVAQIWGTNPGKMQKAAEIVASLGFDGIDINMGCAVKDVIKKGAGAGLIGNYDLVKELINKVKEGSGGLPVSVKTRLGNRVNIALEWTEFLLKQDIALLSIHGRTAKQMSRGEADWDQIGKIVKLRDRISSKTLIVGNGDVMNYSEIKEKFEKFGVDGVMIGRGVFANPWIFVKDVETTPHSKEDNLRLLMKHIELFEKNWKGLKNFSVIKKFFKIYVKGFEGASALRAKLMETNDFDEVRRLLLEN